MNWDDQIITEWRKLGFYYKKDEYNKQWWLIGSKTGLLNLTTIIDYYINEPESKGISEHIHLGWYQYFKIMTWYHPLINSDCIGGSLDNLNYLKKLIERKLNTANPGEILV